MNPLFVKVASSPTNRMPVSPSAPSARADLAMSDPVTTAIAAKHVKKRNRLAILPPPER
jgi:hypothetical protein